MSVFSSRSPGSVERSSDQRLAASPVTILARGTRISGDLQSEGVLQIEGRVEGTVRSSTRVFITSSGEIEGDIHATEIVVAGTIRGNLHGGERVELQAGGAVHGDVTAPKVAVLEGAMFNGLLQMESVKAAAIRAA
jgi:cytoskeletal protein CcmA (bactofilin family)